VNREKKDMKSLVVNIPREEVEIIDMLATREGLTQSECIRYLLIHGLKEFARREKLGRSTVWKMKRDDK